MEKRIYKKDSSGKIRYLSISTEGNMVVQESGVVGTNSPVYNRSTCEAKNIGKANSTTPAEQAILEANSKLTEKMRLGYFNSIEEAQQKGGKDFLLPMLAKDYKKEFKKVTYPCYVQPKLDGMRSLGSVDDGFMSRTGKAIDTLGHINLSDIGEDILDGELYAHGISFQENMKLIKKYRPGQTEQVKYHVYDIVMDAPFAERHFKLVGLITALGNLNIQIVPTYLVHSEAEIKEFHSHFILQGYEGTMIRHSDESYTVNKRSSQLLKYKDFLDEVYTVNEVWPSESRPEQGVVECVTSKGVTFTCGMKFSHAEREEILTNKENYIGKKAEIRFFEYTDSGLPRFPVCVGFREDK
jgi:DNA ligase-1